MEVKQLLKFWPQKHIHLIKIKIKRSQRFLVEHFLISVVEHSQQHYASDIISLFHSGFQIFQKHIDTRLEDGSKNSNCLLTFEIKEVCSEYDFKHHTFNEHFIDVFEDMLHGELLPLCIGNII